MHIKTHNTFIDNAEDLYILVSMYNLFQYSGNYSRTSGILSNYYRDERNHAANEIDADDNNIISNNQ